MSNLKASSYKVFAISSGTPANNQLAIWTDADTLEGVDNLKYDGTDLTIYTSDNNPQLILQSTDADANNGPVMTMRRTSASAADDDLLGQIKWEATDSDGSNNQEVGAIGMKFEDITASSKDSHFEIETYKGNTYYNLQIGSTGPTAAWSIKPSVANTLYLGSSSYDLNRSYVRAYYGYDGSSYSAGTTASWTFQYAEGPATLEHNEVTAGGIVTALLTNMVSDVRAKTNLEDYTGGLTFINNLKAKKWNWNDERFGNTSAKQFGLTTEDVKKLNASWIESRQKDDEHGDMEFFTKEFTGQWQMALLTAIQELSTKNDALEARIAALEG